MRESAPVFPWQQAFVGCQVTTQEMLAPEFFLNVRIYAERIQPAIDRSIRRVGTGRLGKPQSVVVYTKTPSEEKQAKIRKRVEAAARREKRRDEAAAERMANDRGNHPPLYNTLMDMPKDRRVAYLYSHLMGETMASSFAI